MSGARRGKQTFQREGQSHNVESYLPEVKVWQFV